MDGAWDGLGRERVGASLRSGQPRCHHGARRQGNAGSWEGDSLARAKLSLRVFLVEESGWAGALVALESPIEAWDRKTG